MSSPRLLVIEGNSPQTLAEHIAVGGTAAHQGYSNLLRELIPGAIVDTCHPGDPGATLPEGESLAGYDGIAITGSSLHVYDGGPSVMRQIELVRAALTTGTPLFGSCWGLQVITAATVHLDEVEALPAGATVLATNAMSDVQSVEIRTNGSVAWAVQYHPEYPLREIAAIVRRIGTRLIEEGFFRDAHDIQTFAHDLDTLDRDPECKRLSWRHGISKNVLDKKLRVGEVANWIEFQVLPTRVKRGRG